MNKSSFVICIIFSLFVSIAFIAGCGTVEKNALTTVSANPTDHISTVDASADAGRFTSLKLDSAGMPHICYMSSYESSGTIHNDLKYTTWDGITWETETVDSSSLVNNFISLALDGNNRPRISYYDGNSQVLKYASKTGASWNIKTADPTADAGQYSSLAIDGAGNPHISYYNASDTVLRYASLEGTEWDISTADATAGVGQYTSLALDSAGNPHISYFHATNHTVDYVSWESSAWATPVAVSGVSNDADGYLSLALDSRGQPHICYHDYIDGILKYATEESGSFIPVVVDNGAVGTYDAGQYCSIALDNSGKPRISYYDATDKVLKYYWQ